METSRARMILRVSLRQLAQSAAGDKGRARLKSYVVPFLDIQIILTS